MHLCRWQKESPVQELLQIWPQATRNNRLFLTHNYVVHKTASIVHKREKLQAITRIKNYICDCSSFGGAWCEDRQLSTNKLLKTKQVSNFDIILSQKLYKIECNKNPWIRPRWWSWDCLNFQLFKASFTHCMLRFLYNDSAKFTAKRKVQFYDL